MRISIFGFGDFGQLATKHLVPHADIMVYDRNNLKTDLIKELGARPVDLKTAVTADVIILAVTLDIFENTLKLIAPHIKPGTLVADVVSVKVLPAQMMQKLLPKYCQILATHPLFGPITASEKLSGHKIIIDPIRVDDVKSIKAFLTDLDLEVVEMSCDEHDREMAWVHALTFFIGRGLLNINPPISKFRTNYYNELLDVVNVERTHSMELFYTIQRGNPYAEEMRQRVLKSLTDLEQKIQQK